jgi:hypothetical protein
MAEPTGGFVGRERELRELTSGVDDAIAGRGQLYLLAGEPGIGKTRLADEIARRAAGWGARVLWGRCWEGGGAPPYWLWTQVLRACAAEWPDECGPCAPRGPTPATELHELLPAAASDTVLDAEDARFRLFDAVSSVMRACAARTPLVVVLDDLQWADESSLLLLTYLARDLRGARLLLLGAYRDVEARRSAEVGRRIGELACDARTLGLGGLDGAEVAQLVERRTGTLPAEGLASAIRDATDGNPLFVEEVARTLVTQGGLDEQGPASLPLPDRVRAVIGRRTALLSPRCVRVLSIAAVLGKAFDVATLRHVSASLDDAPVDALDEARDAGILTGAEGRLAFAHDLFRETLYDAVGPRERERLHGAVGAALERLRAGELELWLSELAHHFFLAGVARADAAVRYAVRAAERAARGFAHAEAAGHYRKALQALAASGGAASASRCRVLLALGECLWSTGDFDEARRVYEEAADVAEALGLAPELAQAALGFGGQDVGFDGGVVEPRLILLLEKGLARIGPADGVLRASLMARLAAAFAFSDARARGAALAREAVDVARRIGDPRTLHFALSCFIAATWGPDDLDERLAVARETTRLAFEIGGGALAEMHGSLMTTLLECGDAVGAEREAEAYRQRTAVTDRRISTWYLTVRRAMMALLEGRFAEVEPLATHALGLCSERQSRNAAQYYGVQLLALRREQGRLAEMIDATANFAAAYPAVPTWRATLAWVHAELGHDDDARLELERLAANDFADLPRDMFWLVCLWLLSEVVWRLGDVRRAERLYALLLPYRDRCVTCLAAFCAGSLERSLGLLATVLRRWDDADRHFAAAMAVNERIGARPWVAYGEHDVARMLLARGGAGGAAAAAEHLRRAATSARALGMQGLLERVERSRADAPDAEAGEGDEAVLRVEGEYWTLAYRGASARLRDARGLRLIALLLAAPGRDFRAIELATWPAPPPAPGGAEGAARDAGLHAGALGGDDSAPDARARGEYRARLERLREEADEAERFNDPLRAARAKEEIARLARELTASARSAGRRQSADAERARLAVTKAIRYAIRKVERAHPPLGQLLAAGVKTGTSCRWEPGPGVSVRWVL